MISKNKINILHITQSAGGVETYLLLIFKYLNKNRFSNTLLCTNNGSLGSRALHLGINIQLIPMIREINVFSDLYSILWLCRFLYKNKFKYHIIHVHSGKGGLVGRISAKFISTNIVVFTPHVFSYLQYNGFQRRCILFVERILSCWTKLLIASSPSEAKKAISEVRYKPYRVSNIFPNSIEINSLSSYKRNQKNKTLKILMIGRLSYQKNPEMFIRVARLVLNEIDNIKFILLGAGYADEERNNVESLIAQYRLEDFIVIRDWCSYDTAIQYISRCDIFVLTSRYESFGYVTAEAMSYAKPIVATDIDGSRDIVLHSQTGYLVGVDDDQAMAKYILLLVNNPRIRKMMGSKGRKRIIEYFNIQKNITKLEKIYESLLNPQLMR